MSATTKTPYADVHPVASHLISSLISCCQRIALAGSLRRERPLIGDIEIVAVPIRRPDLFGQETDGPTALDEFLDSRNVRFTKRGAKYQQFAYGLYTVDLFLASRATWGSVFTIRTGSADFSKWLVTSQAGGGARPNAVNFHEGRLYAHGRLLNTPEESSVFAALGLAYIPPPKRNGPPANPTRVDPFWSYDE